MLFRELCGEAAKLVHSLLRERLFWVSNL
jgi:hypothetical protein